jgi:ATP-binding cassette subfamily B protein
MANLLDHKKIPVHILLKRTWKYVSKEKTAFIISLLLLFVNVMLGVILPRVYGYFTDYLTGDNVELRHIVIIAGGAFLFSIVAQVCVFIETMVITKAGQRIIYGLRMEVFEHVEKMSQNQFNEMAVGSLVTRVCSYTSQLSEFFTSTLVNIIKNLFTVVIAYVWMLVLSLELGLILTGVVVLLFIISFVFSKVVHKVFTKERAQLSDMNTFLNETLSGMKIIQLFREEKKYEQIFNQKNHDFFKTKYMVTICFSVYRPLVSLIYLLTVAAIIYFGVKFNLSAGIIVSFYLFADHFFEPIQALADSLNHVTRAFTSIERLFNLFDISSEVVDKEDVIDIKEFKGKIEFKHVYFSYEPDVWILKDVSFVINPKETIAFVGATGAGKTTILNLIVRNFEIQSGQILIDDIDINHISLSSLRRGVGQMLQDVFLFTGTIKDNITLFDDSFSDEEIDHAIKYVSADKFIDHLDNGINEMILERGENFSTGQRQLLSFARTIIHKPQIMILDEATANIDTETELIIQESLSNIKNIGTMLIVAHRLSTIQNADKIIVLSHGEIIESGNHQELLSKKGYYYNLYKLQFSE